MATGGRFADFPIPNPYRQALQLRHASSGNTNRQAAVAVKINTEKPEVVDQIFRPFGRIGRRAKASSAASAAASSWVMNVSFQISGLLACFST